MTQPDARMYGTAQSAPITRQSAYSELIEASAAGPDGPVTARLESIAAEDVASALVQAGVRLRGLNVDRPDLEDLFVSITGEGFDVLS